MGIDLNNPFYALGAIVAGAAVGLAGLTIYNRFVVPKLTPPPPVETPVVAPPVVTIPTPDELRMRERAAGVEGRRKTAEEEYIESIRLNGLVEQQNENVRSNNIHSSNFYDQMYNAPPVRHPLKFPAEAMDDEVTEVVDDFQPEYRDYRPQQEYQVQQKPVPQQPKKMTAVVDHRRPPKQVVEETQAMSPEEIESYDHVDIKQIPAEFVNVGNRPEPFENIQSVDNNSGGSDYDLENMEIDEDTIKMLETNAVASMSATAANSPPPQNKKK